MSRTQLGGGGGGGGGGMVAPNVHIPLLSLSS